MIAADRLRCVSVLKKRLFYFYFVISFLPAGAHALSPQKAMVWRLDFEAASAEARKNRKLLLAHFWMEGRPLTKEMEIDTFSDPEVIGLTNEKFVCVKVDIQARPELFERTIGGRGGLGSSILDQTLDVVSTLPGYADAQVFREFLQRAEQGYPKLRAARVAASSSPLNPARLRALAEIYEELNSPKRAQECLQKILALRPKGPNEWAALRPYVAFAHERLARSLALKGRNREASLQALEYRKLDPDNRFGRTDRILLTEGLVAWIERRFGDSLRILRDVLHAYPASEERDKQLLALGTVLHESGDDRPALEALEKVLREHPDSTSLRQVREQIYHIKNPPAEHVHD
jgi:tetratricopeptide (TPR) repeat protein